MSNQLIIIVIIGVTGSTYMKYPPTITLFTMCCRHTEYHLSP